MGAAKRYMEMVESRGWSDVGTIICSACVSDGALVEAVRKHGGADPCDYCEDTLVAPDASAPIELVLEHVVDGLNHEYEDPIEQMAYDGGYVGTVHDTGDLQWELGVTEHEHVHGALQDAIVHSQWCQRDPYAASPMEARRWGWGAFRQFVKHKRRFTFLVTDYSTATGAGEIPMHAIPSMVAEAVETARLVKPLAAKSEWWRVRVHDAGQTYTSAADLGTPPDKVARDNRMSPKGIGAFYGASTLAGARAEVSAYARPVDEGAVGRFVTTTPLEIVDLRDLPAVPSLFDPERRHLRAPIYFLHGFVKDVTEVADPTDKQNLDYVPTQVVAETLRYALTGASGPVTGVLWRSSKDPSLTSCVLFVSSADVADLGSETGTTKLVLDTATVKRLAAPL